MSELANFSIETDTTVLLVYRDGRQKRIPMRQLANHLTPDDLSEVRRALKLRRDFWKQHLPKEGLAIGLTAALIIVGVAGTNHLDQLISPTRPPAVGQTSAISLATPTATPKASTSATPSPTGQVAGAATIAPVATAPASPKPTVLPVKVAVPTPTPTPVQTILGHVVRTVTDPITRLLP